MGEDRPLGPPVDASPARLPQRITLNGRYGRLEPIDAARHGPSLWRHVAGDTAMWDYLFAGPFVEEAAFTAYLATVQAKDDPLAYTIVTPQGDAVGWATLMEIRPVMRVIEVGNIGYSRALQRTTLATEAQFLLMRYAFEDLGYRRYEWKCNDLNAPSKAAALRYGFTPEGLFRQHMIVKGRNRDTAWFSITDREWPAIKAAFEQWLAPDNFDASGEQKRRLEDFRR